jgi:hypothetical protein
MSASRKKPEKNRTGKPRKPPADVREKQDPGYSEDDFQKALERATRRLDGPAEPERGRPRR